MAAFFRERLEFYLREAKGFAYDVTNAVLAAGADNVVDALERAEAVARVRESEDFVAISASVKRIKNILRQATEAGKWPAAERTLPASRRKVMPSVFWPRTAELSGTAGELCTAQEI